MNKLAICLDNIGWWIRFEEFAKAAGLDFQLVQIERSDWLDRLQPYSHVLWRPNLDPPYCEEAREKIYFLEHVLGKRVVPNWRTFWHYDNKRAQYYFFLTHGIPTPTTFISFSRDEVVGAIANMRFPVVSKTSGGASSSNVRLLRTRAEAMREADRSFKVGVVHKALARMGITMRWSPRSHNRYVLWQEFVQDNDRDLRITVVGKKHVFAFWRNNRRGDFRASGSGSIDYDVTGVEQECRYCADLCQRHDFDSMAFDIVYNGKEFMILEMSYTFNDRAIYDAPGHYVIDGSGEIERVDGHVWPQGLTIQYVQHSMEQVATEELHTGQGAPAP